MTFQLENAVSHFPAFWDRIGAEGNIQLALDEFGVGHNPSLGPTAQAYSRLV
jgi:hypothetical protein